MFPKCPTCRCLKLCFTVLTLMFYCVASGLTYSYMIFLYVNETVVLHLNVWPCCRFLVHYVDS